MKGEEKMEYEIKGKFGSITFEESDQQVKWVPSPPGEKCVCGDYEIHSGKIDFSIEPADETPPDQKG